MVKNSFIPSAALILALAAAPPSSAQEAGKGGAAPASALRLSRKAPVVYERQLKALLTPAEKVLARRGDFETNGADGVILLDETLIHSEPDGRRVLVYHRMFQALNESGARMTAEDTFSFRTLDQRIHLAEAQSLPPEGSAVEVEDGSVIMESPQHDAADSVYGDRGQMRIIFPAVKPGTVTRMVVVIEEFDERIPGHFSTWESWGAFWPTRHARTVLHLPEDMEARLRETRLGAGVPEPVKSSAAPGWRTWTYDKHRIKPDRAEHGRPPKSQSGPAVFLTTLPDWETFGDWYRALLRERAEVTEEMAALAREWTRAAGTDEEKAAAILGHVARDIRYTGLEFGLGALQPRAPVEVWKSAFGDCKDKSNLAALLLRSLGIEAHLALIQTEHLGRVERRSPDSRHFNHAIVALRTAQGWQFTDPTLRHVTPGMLAPSSSGRDTLIVKPDCIEWARTPVFEGGLVHYHVDAERAEDGSTEGWLECRAGGFYMATDRAYHENMSREEWKRDAQQTLAGLLPGAQIIDLDTDRSAPDVLWRAYFSQPGRASGGDERVPASFPAGEPVMLSMGQDETRETTRFLWPITWRVTSAVRLPAGWTAAETPPPFDLHTEAYEVEARWEPGSGLLRTFYEGRVPRGDLTPAAHQVVWRGAQSLDAWLQRPLWLARSGETPPAPSPEAAITLGKFPLMPTGEGQLALVDRRYPENGNLDLRRAALRKVLEFFPDDPVTVFNTRTRLATADWEQDKHAEAEKALREILAAPSPKITPEILAWGRYLRALVLMDLKQHEEAARTFEGLAGDTTLSAYRRAWAGFQLSRARAELDQKEGALAAARAGLLLEQAESTPPLLARAAMHLLELDRQQELPPLLASLIERGEDLSVPALTALAQLVAGLHEDGKSAQAATLLDILEKLDFINEGFARALAEAGNALRGGAVAAALQKDLQAWLEARPDTPALKPPPDGWPQSREECAKAFEAADNAASSDLGHRLALRLLTAFEPGTDFPRLLWRAAAHLEHHERQSQPSQPSDLMRFLLDLGLRLPRADDHYWEMRYLQGVVLENLVQDKAAAAKHFSTLADENDMPPAYQPSFIVRAAACHEHLREWEKAAGTWSRLERLTQFGSSGDGLLRAAHLRLEQGNVDEALRLLSLAGGSRDFYLRHTGMKETLEAMLQFADEPALVRATWSLEPAWWPDWKKLRDTLGILESDIEPAIHDVAAFGAEISQAVQEKDAARAGELFRQLAHNARWVPAHVINTVWASLYRMEDLHPRHVRELKLFNLSLLESGRVFTEDNRRARSLYSVMCFLDTDQQEAALNHIGEYFNAHPRDDHAISFTMSRLWALAAVEEKNERPACITRLRQDLAAPALRQDRMASVRQLVRLLRLEDMQSEIRPLLEGELSHPAHSQDQEALAALKDMLRSETEGAAVTRTVQRWLERHAPPWFDAVQPLSLADAGLDDEDADLDEEADNLPPVPRCKLWLLAAQETSLDAEDRVRWFANALSLWPRLNALTRDQFHAGVSTLLDDPQAPADLKDRALRVTAIVCADHDEKETWLRFSKKHDDLILDEYTRDVLNVVDLVFETGPASAASPAASTRAVQTILKEKDSYLLELLVEWLADRALRHGRPDAAQAVADALAPARKPAGFDASELQTLRLGLVKKLSAVKRLQPVHEALARIVLEEPPREQLKGVPDDCDIFGGADYDALGSARWLAVFLHELRHDRHERQDLTDWHTLASVQSELDAAGTASLRRRLISAMTTAPVEDDTARADLASLAEDLTDLDSETERAHLQESLQPWREARDTAAHSAIRLIEARIALRTGGPLDVDAMLRQIKDPDSQTELRWMQLRRARATEDAALARKALDALGADALLDPGRMHIVIPALKHTNRQDELALAVEATEAAFQEALGRAWTGRHSGAARYALELAGLLGQHENLPPGWFDFCLRAYPERMDQLNLECHLAQMRGDWTAVLAAAEELVGKYPTFYSHYWPQARALWKLGRAAEAREPLAIFLRHCHDEPEHAEAGRMLSELDSKR